MKIKGLAALLVTLAGLSFGCSRLEYNLPNEEKAIFTKNYFLNEQSLTIKKSDGRVITYWDNNLDNNIDEVNITKKGETKEYSQREILAEAQKQFDKYISKIESDISEIESKEINDALNDLK